MKSHRFALLLCSALLFGGTILLVSCKKDKSSTQPSSPWQYEDGEENSAGTLTAYDESANAYGHAIPGLSSTDQTNFVVGNSFNRMNWVIAPASAVGTDGLGPLFNARSCSSCHFMDGRGKAPDNGEALLSMIFRLSVPGTTTEGGPAPVPDFGNQLGNNAIPGVTPEGGATILYTTVTGTYPDGSSYTLRAPSYTLDNSALAGALFSPRVAPKMSGVGFFDAIPESVILANADENDANGDGISGKANYVWDELKQATVLGRLGWKANTATTRLQVAHAFVNDIGITSSIAPDEALSGTEIALYGSLPNGGSPEIADQTFEKVYFYTSTLTVPVRRNFKEEEILHGKKLFEQVGCAKCHIQKMQTSIHPDIAYLNNITIRPYTDLLLHDMGPDLADGRPDFRATGSEWRTAPLWGMGVQQTVNGHYYLLHDGRANGPEEAILWHGGEAENSKKQFMNLSKDERDMLIKFLNSL